MDKEKTIEDMVRDFSKVTPRSKKEIRLRITDLVNYREREEYARGREKGRTEAPERYTPTQNNRPRRPRMPEFYADEGVVSDRDAYTYYVERMSASLADATAPEEIGTIGTFMGMPTTLGESIPTTATSSASIINDSMLRTAINVLIANNQEPREINTYVREYTGGRYGYTNGELIENATGMRYPLNISPTSGF